MKKYLIIIINWVIELDHKLKFSVLPNVCGRQRQNAESNEHQCLNLSHHYHDLIVALVTCCEDRLRRVTSRIVTYCTYLHLHYTPH